MTSETEARLDALEAAMRALMRDWPRDAKAFLLDTMREEIGEDPAHAEMLDRLSDDLSLSDRHPADAAIAGIRRAHDAANRLGWT